MRCPSTSSEALGGRRIAKGAPWIMITDEGHGYINRGGRLPGSRRPLQEDEPPGNVFLLANRQEHVINSHKEGRLQGGDTVLKTVPAL